MSVADFGIGNFRIVNNSGSDASTFGVFNLLNGSSSSSFVQGKPSASFQIGPTLATGYFFGASSRYRAVLNDGSAQGYANNGFEDGVPGRFGFEFVSGGTTKYGWAELQVDYSGPSQLTISEWAYEESGAPILLGTIAPVPEPGSGAGLALLAMGAAGIRRRRNKVA